MLLYIKSNIRLLQPNELTLSFKYSTAYLVEVHSNVSTSFFTWVIVEPFFYASLSFRLDSFRPFGSRSPFSGNGRVVTIVIQPNEQATFTFTFHSLFLKINLRASANVFTYVTVEHFIFVPSVPLRLIQPNEMAIFTFTFHGYLFKVHLNVSTSLFASFTVKRFIFVTSVPIRQIKMNKLVTFTFHHIFRAYLFQRFSKFLHLSHS